MRQAVLDRLTQVGMNVASMEVTLTSVQVNGSEADASVSIAPKGNVAQAMSMKYHLQQQGSKWVVVGHQESGASPHGGGAIPAATPGSPNPHGSGGMPTGAAGGAGKMPSPEDLPPVGKK